MYGTSLGTRFNRAPILRHAPQRKFGQFARVARWNKTDGHVRFILCDGACGPDVP